MHSPSTLHQTYLDACKLTESETGCPEPPSPLHLVEAAVIDRLLPEGGVLLDVGTGMGLIPTVFHKLGARAISTDFPTTGGRDHLSRLMKRGIEGHFLQVGVDPMPVEAETVDVVFVGNVIEHLPHTPKYFLSDLMRTLKPGGHIVVDTKNAVDLKTRLKMLLGVSNWPRIESVYALDFNYHHHKEYTLNELTQVLDLAGFEDVHGFAHEVFFKKSLRKWGTLRAMGARPEEMAQFAPSGFNPLHPYEYLRILLLGLTKLMPGARSDILAQARKPLT